MEISFLQEEIKLAATDASLREQYQDTCGATPGHFTSSGFASLVSYVS